MNEPFKLNYHVNNRGNLRAEFRDADNKVCSLMEANTGNGVDLFIGVSGFLSRLNREMARVVGFALLRFARTGSLVKPSPEQQLAHIQAALDEAEQLVALRAEVVAAARKVVAGRKAVWQAHEDGHGIGSEISTRLRSELRGAKGEMDSAVEALEAWLKQHESEEAK